jgi:hypothetical protein
MYKILLGVGLLIVTAMAQADTANKSLKNISEELVKIRQEIETLHNQISYEKDSYKDQMRSYANQKSDLDVRISRSELNIKEIEQELNKLRQQRSDEDRYQETITPVLKRAIVDLKASVSASLPFKLEERLNALDEIEHRLDAHIVSANKAANQLWAFVEDELVLGKSSGIYNDTLKIDGQEKLVKVLRIGKVAMFYKTSQGEFGVVSKVAGQWQDAKYDESEQVVQLEQLFDSFNKNISNGQFITPNFLPKN